MGVREVFKENLKFYRQKANLTQEELSEKIGYGGGYISELESRKIFPKPETIDLIARELNVRAAMLFDERGCPANAREAFARSYGASLESELKERICKDIEEICARL